MSEVDDIVMITGNLTFENTINEFEFLLFLRLCGVIVTLVFK